MNNWLWIHTVSKYSYVQLRQRNITWHQTKSGQSYIYTKQASIQPEKYNTRHNTFTQIRFLRDNGNMVSLLRETIKRSICKTLHYGHKKGSHSHSLFVLANPICLFCPLHYSRKILTRNVMDRPSFILKGKCGICFGSQRGNWNSYLKKKCQKVYFFCVQAY